MRFFLYCVHKLIRYRGCIYICFRFEQWYGYDMRKSKDLGLQYLLNVCSLVFLHVGFIYVICYILKWLARDLCAGVLMY